MIRTWVQRLAWVAATWLAVWAFVTLLDFGTQPVFLAAVVFLAFAVAWMAAATVSATASAEWAPRNSAPPMRRGEDARFSRLARRLADGTDREAVAREVHETLVGLVDHRLECTFGVSRVADPVAAQRVLGDELYDFISQPAKHPRTRYQRQLSDILSRIESL